MEPTEEESWPITMDIRIRASESPSVAGATFPEQEGPTNILVEVLF